MIQELQEQLEKLEYPPTHNYLIKDLIPDNFLKERVERIKSICPIFFSGKCFLDIGGSKGFFTLLASKEINECTYLEPRKDYVDLVRNIVIELKLNNIFLEAVEFKYYQPNKLFDRVFIGNCLHYLYQQRDSNIKEGWSFLYKLASMVKTGGIVIIESPLDGKENPDIKYLANDPDYNRKTFEKLFSEFFEIGEIIDSPSLFRYIIKLTRKDNPLDNKVELQNISIKEKLDYREGKNTFISTNNQICKVFNSPMSLKELDMRELIIINSINNLPTRARLKGVIVNEGKIKGIIQEMVIGISIYRLVWELFVQDQKLLNNLGYCELDWGAVNIAPNGEIFDKFKIVDFSRVMPVKWLNNSMVEEYQKTVLSNYGDFIAHNFIKEQIENVRQLNEKDNKFKGSNGFRQNSLR